MPDGFERITTVLKWKKTLKLTTAPSTTNQSQYQIKGSATKSNQKNVAIQLDENRHDIRNLDATSESCVCQVINHQIVITINSSLKS